MDCFTDSKKAGKSGGRYLSLYYGRKISAVILDFRFLARVLGEFLSTTLTGDVACSKRSDSGERCEVKKAMKSNGGLGREVRERL